jgi:hypothetical protein
VLSSITLRLKTITVRNGLEQPTLHYPWLAEAGGRCPFTGLRGDVRPWRVRGARVAFEDVVDGVDGANAVVAGTDQVGADAAVSGECGQRVPVAGDGLMFGPLMPALRC